MFDLIHPVFLKVISLFHLIASIVLKPFDGLLKTYVLGLLSRAGVGVNTKEKKPGDLTVHNAGFFNRLAVEQTLAIGEMYVEGWYDCDRVDIFVSKTVREGLYKTMAYPWNRFFQYLQYEVFNMQTAKRAWIVAEKHYNMGNEVFKAFLDPSMTYSCAYWKNAKNLEEAQQHKLELIAKKLKLQPGMRVLDIGCGWGSLCKYLAEHHQVEMVGITISSEGKKEADERCQGLPVEIRIADYRELDEKFDRVVSIAMFEHVGYHNYKDYFAVVHRCLIDDGIFLLQTIGLDNDHLLRVEPFLNKWIFPNWLLPTLKDIPKYTENLFCIEDWHNFGADYDKTLMAWSGNLERNWESISHKFEDPKKSYRLWRYFLTSAAGVFRSRKYQLWQLVMSKKGLMGGYESIR